MRRYEPISGITVGAADSDSTIPIPGNRRLLALRLYAYGIAAGPVDKFGADVLGDIQIYVGSRLICNTTAQELLDRAKYNGLPAITPSATVGVPYFFVEPWRASVMDEQVSAWDIFGQAPVTFKCRTKTGLTGVTLKAVLDYDDAFTTNAAGQRVLNIIKIEPINLGSLGTVADIQSPQIPTDLPIQRILLYPAAGVTIQSVQVKVNDSQVVYEMTQAENINFLGDYGLVAEAGNGKMFPVVFDMEQQMFNSLPPSRSLNLKITQSGAGTIKVVTERRSPDYI